MTFEDAYQRHYDAVVRSSWAICRDRHRAEELAQEAFARAYRRWRKLDQGGYAVAWLHRVVMNLTLTAVSRGSRGRRLESMLAPADHHRTDQPQDDWVVTTLRRLPDRQREAVFLRVVADLDVAEVAQLMRCSEGTVKTHTKRGLDRLRELLQADQAPPRLQGLDDGSAHPAPQAARG